MTIDVVEDLLRLNHAVLWLEGDARLDVRSFQLKHALSKPFRVDLVLRSLNDDLDLTTLVGRAARLTLTNGLGVVTEVRVFAGLVSRCASLRTEETADGLSTFSLTLVPELWCLGRGRDNRLFQHTSIPDVVRQVLGRWQIKMEWHIDEAAYNAMELRMQFGESDLAFVSRLLEEAGITYWIRTDIDGPGTVVFNDAPNRAESVGVFPYSNAPRETHRLGIPFVHDVRIEESVRTGVVTLRDYDFANPEFLLRAASSNPIHAESRIESYVYSPGEFLEEFSGDIARGTLASDDLAVARFRQSKGFQDATLRLDAERTGRRSLTMNANFFGLTPGTTFHMAQHVRSDLGAEEKLLVTSFEIAADFANEADWKVVTLGVLFAKESYRPPRVTKKPSLLGVQSAVVVGPSEKAVEESGDDIYVDQWGRVRVQFHWDRLGERDAHSSIWMRVSQGWAGAGYGMFAIPRVGHEVLVSFLDGDIDNPIITGRVHNAKYVVPFPLPANKTVSTWKSESSPNGGGFNEIRFDDAAGREHVFVQAQKNMDHLVKNDLKQAVGRTSSRFIQNDDHHVIGHERTQLVNHNEIEATGMNRKTMVGMNRLSSIGAEDATLVGARWSVTVARGLTTHMTGELDRIAKTVGPVMRTAATSVLGVLPTNPLGDPAGATLSRLAGSIFGRMKSALGLTDQGFSTDEGPPPTTLEATDRQIRLSTGEAEIVLDGPNISFVAHGNITFHARGNATVLSEGELCLAGQKRSALVSATSDVLVQAAADIHLNPFEKEGESRSIDIQTVEPQSLPRCPACTGPLQMTPQGYACPHADLHTEKAT
jgi:type VI secretion system secreted protein VgrG